MKKWIKSVLIFSQIFGFSLTTYGQDDLLDLLETKQEEETTYTIATFKTTKIVSGNSVEMHPKKDLQFMIAHRFGRLNSGWRNLYGVDNGTIRFGFEYGLTDNLNLGFGRSSFQKTFDGTIKYRFLRQKFGAENFPFTASWVTNMYALGNEWEDTERENYFSSRLSYSHSVLIARKFGKYFSLQLSPTVMHRNLVLTEQDANTIYAMGVGASTRLTGSVRFNVEYFYLDPNQYFSKIGGEAVSNSFSVGFDIETGGHVFQLSLSNSRGMTEKYLVGESSGDWFDGDIHFGFNISRMFSL
tara:strand:- start:2187 stop:3083 length:897 start_codon:yes stop_codon:yes gene_type:complete